MVAFMATPGLGASPIAVDAEVHARWTERSRRANESARSNEATATAR